MIYIAQARVAMDTKAVVLSWDPSTELDVAGYEVKMGTSSAGPYETVNEVLAEEPTLTIDSLLPGTYYFIVIAHDRSGNYSVSSDPIVVTV